MEHFYSFQSHTIENIFTNDATLNCLSLSISQILYTHLSMAMSVMVKLDTMKEP